MRERANKTVVLVSPTCLDAMERIPNLQRVGELLSATGHRVIDKVTKERTLQVHITNGTKEILKLEGNYLSPGTGHKCDPWNTQCGELPPQHAGSVRFSGIDQCGGAVDFSLGGERFRLCAVSLPNMKRFSIKFEQAGETKKESLSDFFRSALLGPGEFMGFGHARNQAEGKEFVASVLHVHEDRSEVHVYLGTADQREMLWTLGEFLSSDSWQQLCFAEWCKDHSEHCKLVGDVVFLAEFSAIETGLPGSDREDQVFTLDLLATAFATTGLLSPPQDAFRDSLERWKELQGPKQSADALPQYVEYRKWAKMPPNEVNARLEAARWLLLAVALQCAYFVVPALNAWNETHQAEKRPSIKSSGGGTPTGSQALLKWTLSGIAMTAGDAISNFKKAASSASAGGEDLGLIKSLVNFGITKAATYTKRKKELFAVLTQMHPSDAARSSLQHYCKWLPLTTRLFVAPELEGRIESFSAEAFGNIDEGKQTGPQEVLASLARLEDLEGMKTNSMSGEFFFHSRDDLFLVKTVSRPEGKLLRRMVPAYQAHIRNQPRSLICRYAGAYRVEAPGFPSRYFILMRSVFDPEATKGNVEVYDLKGSLVNRKRREGQSVGKDQDWLDGGCRVQLPSAVRSELCAIHAQDVGFLLDFRVMDYSVLVGSTKGQARSSGPPGWRQGGGVIAEDGELVHFLGLIDHLVQYDLGRNFQNLREGNDAEIIPPDKYAFRQIAWFRENIVDNVAPQDDWGTIGRLRVHGIKAYKLTNRQDTLLGAIDTMSGMLKRLVCGGTLNPYIVVTVGLRSAKTQVLESRAEPCFEDCLCLPIDTPIDGKVGDMTICLKVWSKSSSTLVHDDVCVGKLEITIQQLVRKGSSLSLTRKRLQDATDGELSVELLLETQHERPLEPAQLGVDMSEGADQDTMAGRPECCLQS